MFSVCLLSAILRVFVCFWQDYYCDVTVWYRGWLQGSERLQVTDGPTCTKHQASARALGGRVGGVSQPKPLGTDDIVLNALNFAVCADNDRSNNLFATVLGDTSGVTYTEQVRGKLWLTARLE